MYVCTCIRLPPVLVAVVRAATYHVGVVNDLVDWFLVRSAQRSRLYLHMKHMDLSMHYVNTRLLTDQMKAAAAAAAAAGGGEGGRGGALSVVGTKRKKGAGGSGGGGVLWSPRGDGPSHGPAHSFGTRNTGVVRWGAKFFGVGFLRVVLVGVPRRSFGVTLTWFWVLGFKTSVSHIILGSPRFRFSRSCILIIPTSTFVPLIDCYVIPTAFFVCLRFVFPLVDAAQCSLHQK